jgi:riboflavin kinase/FMN adenylyltransferase
VDVISEPAVCPTGLEGCAVTIGAYDGVHRGHRAVIDRTRQEAARRGARTAVVTFDRHPAAVVRPESTPKLLTSLEHKLELLEQAGVDVAYVVRFDDDRAHEAAADFVKEVLVDCLATRCVVVGADFHFGRHREGNVAMLAELGRDLGFDAVGVELLGQDEGPVEIVSSTRIRAAIAKGDVELAARLLGRWHELRGVVTTGDQRGRTIGFPTANLTVGTEMAIPADGIYAGWYVRPDGTRHQAAINVGRRPTFYEEGELLVEAYLMDFEGDLYGERARVQFASYLRPELKFDAVDALVDQMRLDVAEARARLSRST